MICMMFSFFFSSRRRHTRSLRDWSSDVCSSDLRVSSWADHDALAHYLLAPMVYADPTRCREVFRWAKSRNRWRRRAACVALILRPEQKKLFAEIVRLSNLLLGDQDDM